MVLAAWSSIAFNYAYHPPLNTLSHYDVLVLDPQSPVNINQCPPSQTVLAYVSVGETADSAPYRKSIPTAWVMGSNPTWHSVVMDQSQAAWREFFIDQVLAPLYAKGYRGFFLDTLDAFNRVAVTPEAKQKQIEGLIQLLTDIHNRFPNAMILMNRGFELLPQAAPLVNGVVIESLFSTWNQTTKQYESVPTAQFDALMLEIKRIKAMGLPVVIIDYVDPNQPDKRLRIDKKIRDLGLIPFVTDGLLQQGGLINASALPRRVILLYTKSKKSTIFNPEAFTLLALPLEYMGYRPEFMDAAGSLTTIPLKSDVAGIAVLTNALDPAHDKALYEYLLKAKMAGFKIAFITNFGFSPNAQRLKSFDISIQSNPNGGNPRLKIVKQDAKLIGFEVKPQVNQFDYDLYHANNAAIPLQLGNHRGLREDAVAITAWGGYALDPYVAINTVKGNSLWIINPFEFLKEALRLQSFPIPDVTTENGQRLAFIHIDGDGFASMALWPNGQIAAKELLDRVLKKFPLPTTFSVVTADLKDDGLYPEEAPYYRDVAKTIYALPWVEAATHTFSHPFDWLKMLSMQTNGQYNLPVKNYHYNQADEISGSAQFIQSHLLPPGKKIKILLWSGYANANEAAFKLASESSLLNMNGGDTVITYQIPLLSQISPMGLTQGSYYQPFAPIGNEEYYTNGWSKPLYGYERVIETFKLTDAPRRFKPIDIYYHIYSATTTASLNALFKVYHWALSQPLNWIYASDYLKKVNDANSSEIIPIDHGWEVITQGEVRELRLNRSLGFPDLAHSRNVIGYNSINDSYYLHLGTDTRTNVVLNSQPSQLPYLASCNGKIVSFQRSKDGFNLHIVANQPIELNIVNAAACELRQGSHWQTVKLEGKRLKDNIMHFNLHDKDSHELTLTCPS